jgi:hypothetical protein
MSTRITEFPDLSTAALCPEDADMPAPREQSPVLDLLDTVWNHGDRATSHSWARVNTSLQQALCLAIGSGIKFHPDDFEEIQRRYRFHYWGGNGRGGFAEGFYGLAVAEGNLSAAQAFEKWKGRRPFIVDGAYGGCGARFAHRGGHFRQRGRLAVGSVFSWEGQQVTVTSFAADGRYLVACRYAETPAPGYQSKVAKRFKITHADLRAARGAARQAA